MYADRTGLCMYYKRLNAGVFARIESLEPNCAYVELDEAAFDDLLDAVIIEQAKRPRRKRIH